MMITKLTKEQQARFPEFVDKWKRIGLCTDPANRPEAEKGVVDAYKIAGLEPPKRIVWCGSPYSQGLTRAIVLGLKPSSVGASVRDSVWDSVWASVRASVGSAAMLRQPLQTQNDPSRKKLLTEARPWRSCPSRWIRGPVGEQDLDLKISVLNREFEFATRN